MRGWPTSSVSASSSGPSSLGPPAPRTRSAGWPARTATRLFGRACAPASAASWRHQRRRRWRPPAGVSTLLRVPNSRMCCEASKSSLCRRQRRKAQSPRQPTLRLSRRSLARCRCPRRRQDSRRQRPRCRGHARVNEDQGVCCDHTNPRECSDRCPRAHHTWTRSVACLSLVSFSDICFTRCPAALVCTGSRRVSHCRHFV
mmetsp:Transcript_135319/g.432620  ORF Transcript_135319/g.432620 Transcript_135319/m.432620 type:complete len:201 (+) Transcript_135319:1450-2052(+)